jgi:hypothetical protein
MSPPVSTGVAVGSTEPLTVETDVGEYVKAGGGGDAKSEEDAILDPVTRVERTVPLPIKSTAFEVVVVVCGLIKARTVPPDTVVEKS